MIMNKRKDIKNMKADRIIIGIFVFIISIVLLIIYFSTNYINRYTNMIQQKIEERLFAEGRAVQNMIPIDLLESFQNKEDMNREDYKELQKKLTKYAEDNNLMYIYYMRKVSDNSVQYILDSDPDPKTHCGLDYFEEPYYLAKEAFNGEPVYSLIGDYEPGWDGILSAYIPIFDSSGNVIAVAGVDIDDTDIVKRNFETYIFTFIAVSTTIILGIISLIFIIRFRKKAKDANVASIAKGQFLSKMSHEIRTPMNAIVGFCRMAKNTDDINKKNEYLDNISSSSDYLLELINSILDMSKIEANKMVLNLDKMSIRNIINDMNIILSSQIVKKGQTFNIEISEDIPDYVYCDETKLKQILVNLTANAIKFTPENGDISIKVSLIEINNKSCNLEFRIKDNGIGINKETISKLFTPFEQADGTITRKYGGTGLGLAISKRFIEMMNGTIKIESKEGEGSIFKFNIWLDIVTDTESLNENNRVISKEEYVDCRGKTFLVAEDSMVNQIIEKDILENFGAVVEFANNGHECVEMFLTNPEKYDMIFMDIQMPEMDGLEATKQIRSSNKKRCREIPIVAMTAEVFQDDINNALTAGMDGHLGKPLKIIEIASMIKKLLHEGEEIDE